MSINDSYPTRPFANNLIYTFKSVGRHGTITKAVVFQNYKETRYNLALGDEVNGKMDFNSISNNDDMIKVLSTIAAIIYDFTTHYPDAIIDIKTSEKKRLILYNAIFRRRFDEIEKEFDVFAFREGIKEIYSSDQFYYKFEITRKKG